MKKMLILAYNSWRIWFLMVGRHGKIGRRHATEAESCYFTCHQEAETEQEGSPGYKVSKHTLLIHFLLKYQPPKGSINFPNNGTSWGSSVQTHEPMGEIIYLNHSTNVFFTDKYVLTNLQ